MPQFKAHSGVQVKIADADQGVVQVLFATLNTKDHDGDVTLPGAFKQGQEVRISAYNHASWGPGALPVGKGRITENGENAIFDGEFFLNTAAGKETFETVKAMGDLQEWSYGFDVLDSEPGTKDGQSVNFLKALDVFEVSPVLLGAGIGTRTLSAKSRGGKPAKAWDSAIEQALTEAGNARFGSGNTFACLVDHDDDAGVAIFKLWPDPDGDDDWYVRVSFNLADDGSVTLADDAENVAPVTQWAPGDAPFAGSKDREPDEVKKAVPYKKTDTSDSAWNGPAQVAKLDSPMSLSDMRGMYAWYDPSQVEDGKLPKSAAKFPHHFGVNGAASTKACSAVIAILNGGRGGSSIPDADRQGVYNHVAKHLKDAGETPAELKDRTEPGALKLSDDLATVDHQVAEVMDRLADVTAMRAEKGKGLADETAAEAAALADRFDAYSKALREVTASADAEQHDATTAESVMDDLLSLTEEADAAMAEALARLSL